MPPFSPFSLKPDIIFAAADEPPLRRSAAITPFLRFGFRRRPLAFRQPALRLMMPLLSPPYFLTF